MTSLLIYSSSTCSIIRDVLVSIPFNKRHISSFFHRRQDNHVPKYKNYNIIQLQKQNIIIYNCYHDKHSKRSTSANLTIPKYKVICTILITPIVSPFIILILSFLLVITACIFVKLFSTQTSDHRYKKLFQFVDSSFRGFRTIIFFLNLYFWIRVITFFYIDEEQEQKIGKIHQLNSKRLLKLCEEYGGLYIKFGQELSAMRGIIPDEYCDAMVVLQDKVPSISYDQVVSLFVEDFHSEMSDVFEHFEETPIAAASLAQVHRAITKDGTIVAVKVQYPKVKYFHDGDLLTHKTIVYVLSRISDQFREPSDEMYKAIHCELDFIQEAANMNRAKKNFSHRNDIYVPFVYDSLCSERILTMEFIDGFKINDIEKIEQHGFSKTAIVNILLEGIAEQTFIHGFLHADPHPGNIYVRRRPQNPKLPQIVLLDHGLYANLSDQFRLKYCQFWKSLVLGDEIALKQWCDAEGVPDYRVLTSLLLMQSYDGAGPALKDMENIRKGKSKFGELEYIYKNATEEQKQKLQKRIADMKKILKVLPEELLLILRSSFLLRSVNRDLGAPVNRFTIMARAAARGMASKHAVVISETSLFNKIALFREQVKFEMKLQLSAFKSWSLTLLSKIFTYLGYSLTDMKLKALAALGIMEENMDALEVLETHS